VWELQPTEKLLALENENFKTSLEFLFSEDLNRIVEYRPLKCVGLCERKSDIFGVCAFFCYFFWHQKK